MISHFVEANGLNIFYRVFRDNVEVETLNPTLKTMIVLHGGHGLIDHQIEVEAWKHFSDLLQLVFIDQRGCGRTEGGTLEQWSHQQCGEDLYGFCRMMKIEKPILAGISSGGFVIMECVIHHPELPEAIILCNTEAKKSTSARKAMFLKLGADKAAQAVSEFDNNPTDLEKFKIFAESCVPYFSKKPFALMPGYKEDWNVWIKNAIQWSMMDYRDGLRKAVQCPTLILAGEDDPNHPLASSTELAYCIPEECRHFEVITNAGAPVYQDQPEAFNHAVTNFLNNIKD